MNIKIRHGRVANDVQDSSKPERVSSVSPEQQQQRGQAGDAAVSVGPTDEEIDNLLRNLRNSNTIGESVKAMKTLRDLVATAKVTDEEESKAAAETITRLDGVGTIIVALKEWHTQSTDFCRYALGSLCNITCHVPTSKQSIVRIGGIKTILAASKKGCDKCLANAVGVLGNIAKVEDGKYLEEVATDECIDVVMKKMKKWPNDTYIQECGCNYFFYIREVDGIKSKLRSKNICSLLKNVVDNFHGKDQNVYQYAKEALDVYKED